MSTTTPAATKASLPSRAAVRWYRVALIVLGVGLAAIAALAIQLAANKSTVTSATVHSGPVIEQPRWQSQTPR